MLEMTINDIELKDTLINRIAKLVTMNVSHRQIAAATGVNVNKISNIIANSKVVEKVQALTVANIEQNDLVNRGWDGVEEQAVATVLEQLEARPDAEYALKAAATANKAQRRGSDSAIIDGKTSVTAVIELNSVFIEKLQMMAVGIGEINKESKRVNTLDVQQTETLFRNVQENPLANLFETGEIIDG